MTWRTIVITKESKLSLRLNHLVITTDRVKTIPLSEIGQLIIENPNIILTGHLLNALSDYKIMTILCDKQHLPHSQISMIYGNFRQSLIIQNQISWTEDEKQLLWQFIVKEKISNQYANLKYMKQEENKEFKQYIKDVEMGDKTNREGHAAKVYFNLIFGKYFLRGADTPQNWALNYGYSLLHSLLSRTIVSKGLLTEIGVHHSNQFNAHNLASDLMEIFRPLIDRIVIDNVNERFQKEEKRKLINIFNEKVIIKERQQYLPKAVEIYVDSIIKYFEKGDINKVNFPILFEEDRFV